MNIPPQMHWTWTPCTVLDSLRVSWGISRLGTYHFISNIMGLLTFTVSIMSIFTVDFENTYIGLIQVLSILKIPTCIYRIICTGEEVLGSRSTKHNQDHFNDYQKFIENNVVFQYKSQMKPISLLVLISQIINTLALKSIFSLPKYDKVCAE